MLRPSDLRCSMTMPPWLCTSPFGMPVVPDENSTHSGWSNGRDANLGSRGAPMISSNGNVAGSAGNSDRTVTVSTSEGSRRAQVGQGCAAVVDATAEPVSVNADEDFRLELAEAIHDALRPEVGPAHTPHGAQSGGGEHRDHRLGDVGQVPDDAIARFDPDRLQPSSAGAHLAAQRLGAQGARAVRLVEIDQRRIGAARTLEDLFGVVEPGTGKPCRAGHLARHQRSFKRRRG